jgi:drug/metabolite transporter (DMT)-like permease
VITYQLDGASPIVSVFYRFLLSAVILLGACLALRVPLKFTLKEHKWFVIQGIFMFSVNYMLTYIAEGLVSSGLVAVTFTLLLYYNILGTRLLFKKPVTKNVIIGSLVGGIGIGLIFLREILEFQPGSKSIWGLVIGAVATLFASAGNLVSYKHRENKVPVMASNAYGMLYGSGFTFLVTLTLNETFQTQWTTKFIVSLLYLSVFGSVIAFGAYLSLVGSIGAEKAAYTSIINPIIALVLSSLFENFHWSVPVAIGIVLCLLGNVITLQKPKKRATIPVALFKI